MTINYKVIDDMIDQYNAELNDLTLELEQVKTDVQNYTTQKKELELKVSDEEKILRSLDTANSVSHSAFSPRIQDEFASEISDIRKKELHSLKLELQLLIAKVSAKEAEQEYLVDKINSIVDQLTMVESVRQSVKKQVDSFNNEYFIHQMKEIIQKKRLISLEKTKYSSIISKIEGQIEDPLKEIQKQMQLGMSFLQADPVRGKQEMEKVYAMIRDVSNKTDKLITKLRYIEPDRAFCESLNSYIGDLTQLYPDVKFKMTVANLKPIDNLNMDLNRCLMAYFRSMLNTLLLKCNPKEIAMRFAYEDGYLHVTGNVIGNYIPFYNEMKTTPISIVANVYEKIFLLDGSLNFTDHKDGTFGIQTNIPIKNYLT